jgi:hypothetical protein
MRKFFPIYLLVLSSISDKVIAQETKIDHSEKSNFTVETAIGTDLVYRLHASSLFKYNVKRRIAIVNQLNMARSIISMGRIVSLSPDNFESKNLSISVRFGGGAVLGSGRFSHSFLALAGPQFYRLTESHNYPHFEDIRIKVSTWVWDAGFMYAFKAGNGERYFTTQLYVPALRFPDNAMDVSLSVGIGFTIR